MERTARKRTNKNDGSRRYPPNEYPVYEQTFSRLAQSSSILNDEKRANDLHNASALYGVSECQATLVQLEGNADGYYKKDNTWYHALIPVAKVRVKEAQRNFQRWRQEQVQRGLALSKPKQWPQHLLDERLKAEALLDVRYAEKQKVETRIKQLKAQEEREHKKQVLPNGPLGRIGMSGDKIVEADGQRVTYSEGGIPYVDDTESPYHGMPIATYRVMVKEWMRAVGITIPQLRKRREQIFKEEKKQALKAGEEPPTKKLVVTHQKIPVWMNRLGIGKKDWPKWPEGAKSISKL